MKILSIGNSFSQDAHKWLYDVCKSAGKEIYSVNLYYGGCSLYSHWYFQVNGREEYDYEIKEDVIEEIKEEKIEEEPKEIVKSNDNYDHEESFLDGLKDLKNSLN